MCVCVYECVCEGIFVSVTKFERVSVCVCVIVSVSEYI